MATSGTFYVYEHWRLDRDECFYVGKGKGGRAYKMRDRNRFHTAIVQKVQRDGSAIEVRIVASGLTEEGAFSLEKERIAFWRNAGADLANATNGGDGVSGLKMSKESRLKMRNAKLGTRQTLEVIKKRIAPLIGRKQPRHAIEMAAAKRRGKKLSEEHKAKLSNSHKGKIVSEEARKSLSAANKGRPWSPARRAAHNQLIAAKKESAQ
jgi:hypothetical protein